MRKLIGLLALLGALGVSAAAASVASAEEVTLANGATAVIESASSSSSHITPFAKTECMSAEVCVWSGSEFNGTFSEWGESETGCHSHTNNPELRSGWNRTSINVEVGGTGITLSSNQTFQITSGSPVTGQICFPPR